MEELYSDNRNENIEMGNEEGDDIMLKEVEKAICDFSEGKAPGSDQINSEMIKALDKMNVKIVHKFCNEVNKKGEIPWNLNELIFVPILKKPKVIECANYRS